MSTKRVQASLIFRDAELYNDFILPCKQEKELNSLIVRCLSAYYYNEDARNAIDGTSLEDISDAGVSDNQAICDSLRAALVAQDYFVNELQNTMADGMDDIQSILNGANDMARDAGVCEPSASEYGAGVDRLSPKTLALLADKGVDGKPTDQANLEQVIGVMLEVLISMADTTHNTQAGERLRAIFTQGSKSQSPVTPKNTMQTESDKVVITPESPLEDIQEEAMDTIQTMEYSESIPEELIEEPEEIVSEDDTGVVEDEVLDIPEVPVTPPPVNETAGEAKESLMGLLSSM